MWLKSLSQFLLICITWNSLFIIGEGILSIPFFLFVLSTTSIFFLLNQCQFNAFAIFTVERNDYNEDNEDSSDTKAKIILIEQKYKSDGFTDKIIGKVKNIGNGTAEFVKLTFNLYNKKRWINRNRVYIFRSSHTKIRTKSTIW